MEKESPKGSSAGTRCLLCTGEDATEGSGARKRQSLQACLFVLWFSCIDNTLNDLPLMNEIPIFCLLLLGLLLTKESIPEEARVQNLESPAGRGS